jgi:hypothetical protein
MSFEGTMIHLNGNLMCAVAYLATGDNVETDELFEIALIPLNSSVKRSSRYNWFEGVIRPEFVRDPTEIVGRGSQRRRTRYKLALEYGLPIGAVQDQLYAWYDKLGLKDSKRVAPVTHDYWQFERFVRPWMGPTNYDQTFDPTEVRDLRTIARCFNDLAGFRVDQYPHPNTLLFRISSAMKVDRSHYEGSALNRAAVIGDTYEAMLRNMNRLMVVG